MFPRFAALVLLIPALAAQASDLDEAKKWLEKMSTALRQENYRGIFTYMRGYQFDTVKVVHKYVDGEEFERMVHLNGERREIIRDGDRLICKHAGSDPMDAEHEVPLGPFSHWFNENLATYQNLYRVTLHGEGRIADRPAVRVGITPKFGDRYGYRLWLDEETGLLLQSHLVNRGRVLEVFQFVQVEIGTPIADADLASALPNDAPEHRLTVDIPETDKAATRPNWKVSWVPDGFRAVRMPQANRLLFTDGLATFSVFVEQVESGDLPELTTHMGGTVVITRNLENSSQQITVVGEVPIQTARKVAESVEPIVYQ
ncbi:MAG: MucB/RseB C-terminal domain-containing protein [Pseudomonadales bacterium]|nr:MucB/RseB C-terminal domain-containing protein [Pseudomonadales bacterium]